eukprot:1881237-Prymnesium_polylepis.1
MHRATHTCSEGGCELRAGVPTAERNAIVGTVLEVGARNSDKGASELGTGGGAQPERNWGT